MLLPQTKEREYRFKLALRMGLPIFALLLALIIHTFIDNSKTLQLSFYLESLLALVFSIYFIFYLIYSGFEVKITDDVSKTFTREYLYKYLKDELKKKEKYTFLLISIDNLQDINSLYGLKNGDKVLEKVAIWVGSYLQSQTEYKFPLGHLKGGDFIIGLEGFKEEYVTMLELMCLKANEFKVAEIEVKLSAAISDSNYSKDLDYIIENLYEIQEENRNSKVVSTKENFSPNELESAVINAISKRHISVMTQDVFSGNKVVFKECFIKIKIKNNKMLYPKSYMKIINKLGLGLEYDLMVLEDIILNANVKDGEIYAINVSPTSLRNEIFLSTTKDLLKDSKIKIMFILSEAEYYSHISRYKNILEKFKCSDILIAIDRLGSIHTSFLYLRELSVDFVRFDSYYSHKERLKENSAIIKGFNLMAHEKGIKTWMKNIENIQTLKIIQELEIDCLQGKELSSLLSI